MSFMKKGLSLQHNQLYPLDSPYSFSFFRCFNRALEFSPGLQSLTTVSVLLYLLYIAYHKLACKFLLFCFVLLKKCRNFCFSTFSFKIYVSLNTHSYSMESSFSNQCNSCFMNLNSCIHSTLSHSLFINLQSQTLL